MTLFATPIIYLQHLFSKFHYQLGSPGGGLNPLGHPPPWIRLWQVYRAIGHQDRDFYFRKNRLLLNPRTVSDNWYILLCHIKQLHRGAQWGGVSFYVRLFTASDWPLINRPLACAMWTYIKHWMVKDQLAAWIRRSTAHAVVFPYTVCGSNSTTVF